MQQYAVIRSFTKGGAPSRRTTSIARCPSWLAARARNVEHGQAGGAGEAVSAEAELVGAERLAPPGTKGHLSPARARRLVRGVSVERARRQAARRDRARHAARRVPRPAAGPAPCSTAARTATSARGARAGVGRAGVRLPRLGVRRPRRLLGRPGFVGERLTRPRAACPPSPRARRRASCGSGGARTPSRRAIPSTSPAWMTRATSPCGAPSTSSTPHAAPRTRLLDVPHTAFLHRGRFRGGDPSELEAVRRRLPGGGLEVQYLGERRRGPATRSRVSTARRSSTGTASSRASRRWSTGTRALAPDGRRSCTRLSTTC